MNTEILTDFNKTFDAVKSEPKDYPIHYHGYVDYYSIDTSSISTEKLLDSYHEHKDTLGIG